jgi:hypothetical protein
MFAARQLCQKCRHHREHVCEFEEGPTVAVASSAPDG